MSISDNEDDPGPPTTAADLAQDIRLPICAEQFQMARSALGVNYRQIRAATGVAVSTLAKIGHRPITPRIMGKLRRHFEEQGVVFITGPDGWMGAYILPRPVSPRPAKADAVAEPNTDGSAP
jgi:hypothetical protein